jgi:hypothetical protein
MLRLCIPESKNILESSDDAFRKQSNSCLTTQQDMSEMMVFTTSSDVEKNEIALRCCMRAPGFRAMRVIDGGLMEITMERLREPGNMHRFSAVPHQFHGNFP